MSLHIAHRAGALVVSAFSSVREDSLDQLVTVLENLLPGARRVVVDLSQVTLAPSERVTRFMEHLTTLREASDVEIVVVADRISARRVLHAARRGKAVAVVSSLAAGLDPSRIVPSQRTGSEEAEAGKRVEPVRPAP